MNNANLQRLLDAIADPQTALSPAIVDELDRCYPFFTLPDAIMLQRAGDSLDRATRERLSARLVLNATDPDALMTLIDPDHADWADFYPDSAPATPSTDDTITGFLDRYGKSDPAEDALLERLIFNPVPPDYAALLEQEGALDNDTHAASPADSTSEAIDAFINRDSAAETTPAVAPTATPSAVTPADNSPEPHAVTPPPVTPPPYTPRRQPAPKKPTPPPVSTAANATSDSLLSESLAKIYIKQGRYDKAYEIIHSLSLNFPKKSIYFADQLRFLRLLIKNQQSKQ